MHESARSLFPNGVTHDARRQNPFQLYYTHAEGAAKYDVDGNRILDYFPGHGALILGHSRPEVVRAVQEQMARGTHFSGSTELEMEWGNWVKELIPSAEKAIDVRVPGDISTAAAWIVAATLHPDADLVLESVGVSRSRAGILDVLRAMGADIELQDPRVVGGEPVADLRVRSAALRGVRIDGVVVPRAIDELPLLALAGALAEGDTVIADAAELRVKESDRVATTAATLRALGAEVEEHEDGLAVAGGARLRGAPVEAAGDHRLAMLGAVAGLLAEGETTVSGAGAVSVSYPDFWGDLARVGAAPVAART